MTRFIHTADWQLGMTRHFLSTEEQARYAQAQLDVVGRIAALAREERCEFVLVCGDVFESNQLDRQVLARALDAMAAFDVPLYLLPGNHDPANAASVYSSATFAEHRPENVITLTEEPLTTPGGALLLGAPWESKHPLRDLAAAAADRIEQAGAGAAIIAAHGAVDSLSPDASDPALISLQAAERSIASGAVQYLALGDRHSVTPVGASGRIWYSGAPLATDFTESDPGQVLLVDVGPAGAQVERRRVGDWAFVTRRLELGGREDVEQAALWLKGLPNKRNTVVKLSFVGTLSLADKALLDSELEHAGDLFASLDIWERHTELAVMPDDGDVRDLGLSGFAAEVFDELREQAGLGGVTAQDALGLLYRLAGGAR